MSLGLDNIIRQSLRDFADEIACNHWHGKEREAVSLYAFGHLIRYCHRNSALYDQRQIGIEVRVPKPARQGIKKEVCKDLIIWRKPAMTCWDDAGKPTNYPLAVLEWKVNSSKAHIKDVHWLQAFSADNVQVVGYAICIELREQTFSLSCARVQNGAVCKNWLTLSKTRVATASPRHASRR